MKSLQTKLRILMATGSVAAFFSGWLLLAHAPKPVQSVDSAPQPAPQPAPLPTLELPSLAPDNNPAPQNLQPLPALPSGPTFSRPRLRTHGS